MEMHKIAKGISPTKTQENSGFAITEDIIQGAKALSIFHSGILFTIALSQYLIWPKFDLIKQF